MVYYPCVHKQPPAWHEIVVFQKAQALPSFIVEIGVDLLPSLSLNYTLDGSLCLLPGRRSTPSQELDSGR